MSSRGRRIAKFWPRSEQSASGEPDFARCELKMAAAGRPLARLCLSPAGRRQTLPEPDVQKKAPEGGPFFGRRATPLRRQRSAAAIFSVASRKSGSERDFASEPARPKASRFTGRGEPGRNRPPNRPQTDPPKKPP